MHLPAVSWLREVAARPRSGQEVMRGVHAPGPHCPADVITAHRRHCSGRAAARWLAAAAAPLVVAGAG